MIDRPHFSEANKSKRSASRVSPGGVMTAASQTRQQKLNALYFESPGSFEERRRTANAGVSIFSVFPIVHFRLKQFCG